MQDLRIFPAHTETTEIFFTSKNTENPNNGFCAFYAFLHIFAFPFLRGNFISHRKHRKHRIFIFEHGLHGLYGFLILRCNIFFCDFCDFCVRLFLILHAISFSYFFAISRVFAIPFLRGNDLNRENFISHRKHRKHRIFIFEHGLHGLYGFLILRCNIFFCDFCDFCVTIIFLAEGTFLSHTENTENTEIIYFSNTDGTDGGYCARNIHFRNIFAFSRIFAIPSHRGNGLIIYREKLQKIQTYAKIIFHTENTENTEIIYFSNTDGTDGTDGGYCGCNILSVISE